MSWERVYLASESNARNIGANRDGHKNADYVFFNPTSGLVLVKEEGQKPYVKPAASISDRSISFFDTAFVDELIKTEQAKDTPVIQAPEAKPEMAPKTDKVKKKK